jgi:hypothetical protein
MHRRFFIYGWLAFSAIPELLKAKSISWTQIWYKPAVLAPTKSEISEFVTILFPKETPLLDVLAKYPLSDTPLHDWLNDDLKSYDGK